MFKSKGNPTLRSTSLAPSGPSRQEETPTHLERSVRGATANWKEVPGEMSASVSMRGEGKGEPSLTGPVHRRHKGWKHGTDEKQEQSKGSRVELRKTVFL